MSDLHERVALLPCPFCGQLPYETRTVNGTEMYLIGCASCGVELKAAWYRGEPKPTKDIAMLWNRRCPGDGGLRELAQKAAEGGKAAADELMTEFISKKRAANWGIINEGLLACDALLRALAGSPEGR